MKIELLHISGCPHTDAARQLIKKTQGEFGLSEEFREIEITDSLHAQSLRFAGSPTIRVDGNDVETQLFPPTSYGLSCRMYITSRGLSGVPTIEMVREAIRLALSPREEANTR